MSEYKYQITPVAYEIFVSYLLDKDENLSYKKIHNTINIYQGNIFNNDNNLEKIKLRKRVQELDSLKELIIDGAMINIK